MDAIVAMKPELADVNVLIKYGAENGNVELCSYAWEHGATDFDSMRHAAAMNGNWDLFKLARVWSEWDEETNVVQWF